MKTIVQILFLLVIGGLIMDLAYNAGYKKDWKMQEGGLAISPFGHIETYFDAPLSLTDMSFQAPQGQKIRLSDLKGQYVVLNAWATWCAPCVKELPSLQNLQDKIEDKNWRVLAISVDFNVDIQQILDFAQKHQAQRVAGYWDYSEALQNMVLDVGGVPVTYLISPEGKILARVNGAAQWDSPDVIKYLENLEKG